ncbi:hypothetical protein BH09ACT8_BH09ACT8_40530 [soil metagenome]
MYPPAVLAKQLASIADAAGADFHARGRVLDDTVRSMRLAWQAEPTDDGTAICAVPVDIPLLFGGTSKATVRRVAELGDGWVSGALRDYEAETAFAQRIRRAWSEAGRAGAPRLHTCLNFAFDDGADEGRGHISRYYGFAPDYAELNIADLLTSAEDARRTVAAYDALGFDRLLFCSAVTSVDQVDRLADAVLAALVMNRR